MLDKRFPLRVIFFAVMASVTLAFGAMASADTLPPDDPAKLPPTPPAPQVTEPPAPPVNPPAKEDPKITQIDGDYFLMSGDEVLTGWQDINGELYYFFKSESNSAKKPHKKGAMARGWQKIGEDKFYFYTEDVTTSGKTHPVGSMAKGWQNLDGYKFYFFPSGKDETGAVRTKGAMATGWQEIKGAKFYFFKSASSASGKPHKKGAMATGLQKIGEDKYYFYQKAGDDHRKGQMAKGPVKANNESYFFDRETGKMMKKCIYRDFDGKLYAIKENGEQFAICLDAGHIGLFNQSPVNRKYYESVMAWDLHLLLRDELEQRGFRVVLTRTSMYDPMDVDTRGSKAIGCDLLISIHSDASDYSATDYPTAWCAVDGSSDDIGILLARTIASTIGTRDYGRIDHRYYPGTNDLDYWGVVRNARRVGSTGILLEHSFHTNLRTTNWLLQKENLAKLAEAEADTLEKFYFSKNGSARLTVTDPADLMDAVALPETKKSKAK